MSLEELRRLLSVCDNNTKIDFGDRYLVKLDNTDADIITCVWVDKAEKDAADDAKRKKEEEEHEAATSLPLEQSRLDKRLVTVLKNAGIRTIYELAQNDIFDLLPIKGFGWKSIPLVETELRKHGWSPGGHRVEDIEETTRKKAKRKK